MRRFVDIHHHILYGLDDGPQSYHDMVEMLCAAVSDGIGTIYATPHMTPGIEEFDEALMRRRLGEVNDYCSAKALPLRVLQGAEILYTPALENYLTDHSLPTLGETRYVLIEFTPVIPFGEMERAVKLLNRFSYIPVLAHVERYRCLYWHTRRFKRLRNGNAVFFQVNCGSVLKRNGVMTQWRVMRLLRKGLVDYIASDAHNTFARKSRMISTYRILKKSRVSAESFFSFSEIHEK